MEKDPIQLGGIKESKEISDAMVIEKCEQAKKEYFTMMSDIHSLLLECEHLNNQQKLEYCNSERYFMKIYLKLALFKINNYNFKI